MPISGYVERNGIPTGGEEIRVGDRHLPLSFLPGHASLRPDFSVPGYESALSRSLREYVRSGDRVVVIGGGRGVTATIAAKHTCETGSVVVFEGSAKWASRTRKTLQLNEVDGITEVHHAIVEKAIAAGDQIAEREDTSDQTTPMVRADDLPECDVLEMDCEGAELDILRNMKLRPRVILVETHGVFGAPTEDVKDVLTEKGYDIDRVEIAEERFRELHTEQDVKVITAVRVN
jgi:FkbM family methyltransferase